MNFRMKIEISRQDLFLSIKDSVKIEVEHVFEKCLSLITEKYSVIIDIDRIEPKKLRDIQEKFRILWSKCVRNMNHGVAYQSDF